MGVAGAGRSSALAAVREAFEAEGFEVIGTSTSGQAARTLKRQAGIEASRTLASITWRLDHGRLALTNRHVVIVDEAAMGEDAALLPVLSAASRAEAKVVLVGDHGQLGAVGPGGGFESLVARYGAAVHVLDENVCQRDVAERAALSELRDGDVARLLPATRDAAASSWRAIAARPSTRWCGGGPPTWPKPPECDVRLEESRRCRARPPGREPWRSLGRLGKDERSLPAARPTPPATGSSRWLPPAAEAR